MENTKSQLKNYIQSGQYFKDARRWYKYKYLNPFSQRSLMLILSIIGCAIFLGILINISKLFPTTVQVKYSIEAHNSADKAAQIIRADQVPGDPVLSITDILIRNYVTTRESYDYEELNKQFIYIKNNSTRIAYRRFYNFMDIGNPSSPTLKYQKDAKRNITVISAKYSAKNTATVIFEAKAFNKAGELLENSTWKTDIEFEIDEINTESPSGSRFNFTVTNYQPQLLKDNKQGKS